MVPFLIIISLIFLIASGYLFFLLKNQKKSNADKLNNHSGFLAQIEKSKIDYETLLAQNNNLLLEKNKGEEKNKKLWAMSETVHKERKTVDEANEKLSTEKERLAAEKAKIEEKVKKLWSQSTAIHKEKERINELKLEIEEKHQEIIDSVNYAKRIQSALLASHKLLGDNLPEHFILFQPKDIVSGDFYWATTVGTEDQRQFCLVAADSTGHGVPGAIMSILNISCLSEAVNAQKLISPNQILDYTRHRIMEHMANDGSAEGGKDGMDAVICNFDFTNNKLQFAAANNPLWLIRNNELLEYKPDKMPVGKAMGEIKPFTLQEIDLQKGDLVIMITDGFADQFGGPKGKKFMYKPLKELIKSLCNASLQNLKQEMIANFENWKGTSEQVDDVLIIGVRV
jgi:serine phosphatase RsbU (regulator of sigma subunit)